MVDRGLDHDGVPPKPQRIDDPRFNSHTTDLKPLFPDSIETLPYIISRNKNSISLIDYRNKHIQPLIEIRNCDLFCEKLCVTIEPESGLVRLMYVSWQNDKTFVKEITLPETFINTLKSAADL